MKKLEFTISIDAPREKVWNTIIGTDTYPLWVSAFMAGSCVETDWQQGSEAFFLDGKGSGMFSEIMENKPGEYLSIRHLGDIKDGKKVIDNDHQNEWYGAMENYTLKTTGTVTTWLVEMDVVPDYEEYFRNTWPKAMEKVREIAEQEQKSQV